MSNKWEPTTSTSHYFDTKLVVNHMCCRTSRFQLSQLFDKIPTSKVGCRISEMTYYCGEGGGKIGILIIFVVQNSYFSVRAGTAVHCVSCSFICNSTKDFKIFYSKKITFSHFGDILKMGLFGKNWPKFDQNIGHNDQKRRVFAFFPVHQIFIILEAYSLESKKITSVLFLGNLKNGPFWLNFLFEKNIWKLRDPVRRLSIHFFSLNMVSIVEVDILVSCHSQIGLILIKKMVKSWDWSKFVA